MATKNGAPALEFIRQQLRKNPEVAFADVKAAAEKKGFTIYPIMYGRALSLEGLVRPGARRRNRTGGAQGATPRPPRRSRTAGGGPPRAEQTGPGQHEMSGLDAVMAAVRKGQRCRSALQEIQRIIEEAL